MNAKALVVTNQKMCFLFAQTVTVKFAAFTLTDHAALSKLTTKLGTMLIPSADATTYHISDIDTLYFAETITNHHNII